MKSRLTAIIIDDEEHCRSSLKKQIQWSCPEVEVVGEANNIENGFAAIKESTPDVVFLDIAMPGGSGFDLLRQFDKVYFSVIFTTAYDEYALQAFNVNAIAYLLKPVDGEELIKSVEKVHAEEDSQVTKRLDNLLDYLRVHGNTSKKIPFPVSDGLEFIPVDKIMRCESDGSYCHIYVNDAPNLFLSKTLKQVEGLINNDKFLRVHHSHLVNIDYIKRYIRGKGGQIIMDDNTSIPVSRTRKDGFLDNLK